MKRNILFFLCMLAGMVLRGDDGIKAVLFPFREAVLSSRVESTLKPYAFRIGEAFPKDAVLTTLDDAVFTLKLQQRQKQAEFAKVIYLEKKELRANNYTSDFELNKAEFELKMAELAYKEARLDQAFCRITAPFAGKIVEIMTKEYETIRPGQQICRIIDDHALLAVMNIPQNRLPAPGKEVAVKLDGSGMTVKGTVYEISPQADHRTGTVRIRVLIDNKKGTLRPGLTGELCNEQ